MFHQVQESPHGSKSGLKVSEFVDQGLKQSYTSQAGTFEGSCFSTAIWADKKKAGFWQIAQTLKPKILNKLAI